MNWRVVLVAAVAFVVGVGAGGLAEHQHLKSSSKTSGTVRKTSPTTVPSNWFGGNATKACPALKQAAAADVATFNALFSTTAWTSTRVVVVAQADVTRTALQRLTPLAIPAGRAELAALVTYENRLKAAALAAATRPAYVKAQKLLRTNRLAASLLVLSRAEKRCTG